MSNLSSFHRILSLRLAIAFAVIAFALFYFGGGDFICGEPFLSTKGNYQFGDVMLGAGCVAVEIGGDWFGIRSIPRFFGNFLIQAVMIGGSIGAFLCVLRFSFQAVSGIEVND